MHTAHDNDVVRVDSFKHVFRRGHGSLQCGNVVLRVCKCILRAGEVKYTGVYRKGRDGVEYTGKRVQKGYR